MKSVSFPSVEPLATYRPTPTVGLAHWMLVINFHDLKQRRTGQCVIVPWHEGALTVQLELRWSKRLAVLAPSWISCHKQHVPWNRPSQNKRKQGFRGYGETESLDNVLLFWAVSGLFWCRNFRSLEDSGRGSTRNYDKIRRENFNVNLKTDRRVYSFVYCAAEPNRKWVNKDFKKPTSSKKKLARIAII